MAVLKKNWMNEWIELNELIISPILMTSNSVRFIVNLFNTIYIFYIENSLIRPTFTEKKREGGGTGKK